jgi:hypothetical protein
MFQIFEENLKCSVSPLPQAIFHGLMFTKCSVSPLPQAIFMG